MPFFLVRAPMILEQMSFLKNQTKSRDIFPLAQVRPKMCRLHETSRSRRDNRCLLQVCKSTIRYHILYGSTLAFSKIPQVLLYGSNSMLAHLSHALFFHMYDSHYGESIAMYISYIRF